MIDDYKRIKVFFVCGRIFGRIRRVEDDGPSSNRENRRVLVGGRDVKTGVAAFEIAVIDPEILRDPFHVRRTEGRRRFRTPRSCQSHQN